MNKKLADLFKSKVLANSAWLIVLQVFNTIVPLLTLPYITRVLGTSNYGVFSLALNWVTYFQVIVEYGFGFTGARKFLFTEMMACKNCTAGLLPQEFYCCAEHFCNEYSKCSFARKQCAVRQYEHPLSDYSRRCVSTHMAFSRQTGHEVDCYYQCSFTLVLGTNGFCTGTQ